MKKIILLTSIIVASGSLLAAASPKDDITAAAKKLAGSGSYSWVAHVDLGPDAPFTPPPTDGKTDKNGYTSLTVTFNGGTTIGLSKDSKVAVKTEDGWKTAKEAEDAAQEGFDPGAFMARRMENLKAPADEIPDLLTKSGDVKKDGDTCTADLTEDGAKALLTFGFRRPGNQGNSPKGAKGSVKFWLKDGAVPKYEIKVSGKMEFQGEERDIQRTTTVEIKDVGSTSVTVPEDAKKKL
jgi:hypothetical protein